MRSFGMGLLEGLAKSTTKGVNDAMNDLDDRVSRLSEKKINREINERGRFDEDFRGNEEEIKFLANQLNVNGGTRGMEVLHSLINKESWTGAKALVPSIVKRLNSNGLVAGDTYMPLGETVDGYKIPSSKQLANLITIPMNIGDDSLDDDALKGTGMGILNIFARGEDNVAKYVSNRIKADRALAGASNLKPDFGELSVASDINVDKFDLQLGQSYAADLKLIRGRIDQLGEEAPEALIAEEKRFASLISNIGDKQLTVAQQKSTKGSYESMLSSYANIGGRLEYDGSWNSVNKKAVNAGIASDFSTKFKDTVMWAKSVNGRGENQQTARGFIPATLANEFSKISDTFFDKPIEPNTMIELAARNGIDVMRVSKEMIATGDYEDKNNGNPYIVATGKIEFDMAELNNSATTSGLPNNKVFKQSKPDKLTPLGTVKMDLNVLKTTFANKPTGTSARMWKKYFTQENVVTEQDRKNQFKQNTGKDWLSTYGSII
tara:strand:+ start:2532 stop:4007 length:1476 start_codon:yes stop_codon:yes gene_type:complete